LLLADEQENMLDKYLERGRMFVLVDGGTEFVYISVTSPPINFGYAYQEKK